MSGLSKSFMKDAATISMRSIFYAVGMTAVVMGMAYFQSYGAMSPFIFYPSFVIEALGIGWLLSKFFSCIH